MCFPGKQKVVGCSTCLLFSFVILSTMSVRLTWAVAETAQLLMMKTISPVDSCQWCENAEMCFLCFARLRLTASTYKISLQNQALKPRKSRNPNAYAEIYHLRLQTCGWLQLFQILPGQSNRWKYITFDFWSIWVISRMYPVGLHNYSRAERELWWLKQLRE